MPKEVHRGFCPTDAVAFSPSAVETLQRAQKHLCYLLTQGYGGEQSVTFIGNRFQFSARQRMALMRATASAADVAHRRQKERPVPQLANQTVLVDGFNLIILLEAALSPKTTLLRCMDGTLRDLCSLHGTYRPIAATRQAALYLLSALQKAGVAHTVVYLDAPVSNSGRLRALLIELAAQHDISCEVQLVPNADALLWGKHNVVSSDAIMLDRCESWANLGAHIVDACLPQRATLPLDWDVSARFDGF